MPHRTTRSNRCKIHSFLLARLRATLIAVAERAFTAADADARQHGWQVTSIQGGLGRSYRDPRFDTLAACPDCHGRGVKGPANPCQVCSGTGRVVIESAADAPSSPPPRD
jgi:cytochrome c553